MSVFHDVYPLTAGVYWYGEVAFPLECDSDQELQRGIARISDCEGFEQVRGFEQSESQSTCFLFVSGSQTLNLHCLDT
jgi:hypothetical protein